MSQNLKTEVSDSMEEISPTTVEQARIPDTEELTKFRSIFENNMPSPKKPIRHDSTAVLMLSFDSEAGGENSLDVRDEVQELQGVFRDEYNFEVENKAIPPQRAQVLINMHISMFAHKYEKTHALLIIYYAGHGWRSNDSRRTSGFDLLPADTRYGQQPSPGTYVMWEVAESILLHVKCDVLVIFDCCDAGSLASDRSGGRAFEYLGACARGRRTYRPGKNSFTSAMIWALRELNTGDAFTTATLRDRIREYPLFPKPQRPVLFTRVGYLPEHIWMSCMQEDDSQTSKPVSPTRAAEFRDENCSFVDFRVMFNRHLSAEDAVQVAYMMRPLVVDSNAALNARHVEVLNKSTCRVRTGRGLRSTATAILLAQRWKQRLDKEEFKNVHLSKRARTLEPQEEESDQYLDPLDELYDARTPNSFDDVEGTEECTSARPMKRSRHLGVCTNLGVVGDAHAPRTPISEGQMSETETLCHLDVKVGIKASSHIAVDDTSRQLESGSDTSGNRFEMTASRET